MQVSLTAETLTPGAGSEIAIALVMKPDEGWHGYWINSGDAGAPDKVAWHMPQGVSISALKYPAPERLIVAGLMNYVYSKPYALLARLKIPPGLAQDTALPISASIRYLVCSDTLCVPEDAEVSLPLRVGDGSISRSNRARFDKWQTALPRPLDAQPHFAASPGGRIMLGVPLAGASQVASAYFYPLAHDVIDHAAPQRVGVNGDLLIIELPNRNGRNSPKTLSGVVTVERHSAPAISLSVTAVPGPVARPNEWLTEGSSFNLSAFLLTMLAAIAGGLFLNAMPCVFPILSLKALSLARSGESKAAARTEALAYTAGIMLTCVALGIGIILLRAGGQNVGWAFQLQNPHVILLLMLLTAAIGLNLAGLFELPALSINSRHARSNAFVTGILAAFVATPCTGPFMGAALGASLLLPAVAAIGVFAGLGLGLALPFIIIAWVPALRTRLPRPGRWMERFRHILAVPMLLTAAALVWILWRQTGNTGLLTGLAALIAMAFLLWRKGIWQRRGRTAIGITLALIAVIAAPAGLIGRLASLPPANSAGLEGERFSEARLAALRKSGKPVFVYFTADWCLTCKVNERTAIDREAVRRAFARAGIVTLVGDWTNGDPAITRFLEAHGRNGIPVYLFYPAGGGQPQMLPQLLTVSMLTDLAN